MTPATLEAKSVKVADHLPPAVFEGFRELIYERCGIALGDNKQALVKARIQKRVRTLGLPSFEAYLKKVQVECSESELIHLIDAVSTNVTGFYREPRHFELLRSICAARRHAGQARFRIWSSACSSGEEPYTIAIEILDQLGETNVDVKILATDISTRMLERCRAGVYPESAVDPVPRYLLQKYFLRTSTNGEMRFTVIENARSLLCVARFNLTSFPYDISGPLDVIFCRNVMIYFDRPTRERIVAEFRRILRPGGYLFVGHAESLTGMSAGFAGVGPAAYRRS